MAGRRFLSTKGVARFCVALCLMLAVQTAVSMLDRLQHVLDVDHAPTLVAGQFTLDHRHEHDHGHDHGTASSHGHDGDRGHHDDAADQHSDTALPHQHSGDGTLAPWLVGKAPEISAATAAAVHSAYSVKLHADAAIWQRERPPKAALEDLA